MGKHKRDDNAAQMAADAFDLQYGTSQAMARKTQPDADTRIAQLKSSLSEHYQDRKRRT